MADNDKIVKQYQRNFILVDIKGNAEFVYKSMKEISDKLGISESLCYEAKDKHKRIQKRYFIKNYRE